MWSDGLVRMDESTGGGWGVCVKKEGREVKESGERGEGCRLPCLPACHIPVQHLSHAFTYTPKNSSLRLPHPHPHHSPLSLLRIIISNHFPLLQPPTSSSPHRQPHPLLLPHHISPPRSWSPLPSTHRTAQTTLPHPHATTASTIITIKTNTPLHTHSSPTLPPSSSLLQPHTHHHHLCHHHAAPRPSQSRPTPQAAAFRHTVLTLALSHVETKGGFHSRVYNSLTQR